MWRSHFVAKLGADDITYEQLAHERAEQYRDSMDVCVDECNVATLEFIAQRCAQLSCGKRWGPDLLCPEALK
eukprot:8133221-Alexandrium_andersonii.AAC.1